jgi:hypothetical protein
MGCKITTVFCLIIGVCQIVSCDNGRLDFNTPTKGFDMLDSCNGQEYVSDTFEINILENAQLPYFSDRTNTPTRPLFDESYVPIHVYKERESYHPLYIAQYGIQMIEVYKNTKRDSLLTILNSIALKLEELSIVKDSAIFYPYTFDFPLHDIEDETMVAPWYSGMCQGQVLSFYCRLFEITADTSYINKADSTFNSFLMLKGQGHVPWVSCVDSKGNLWLEEYPRDVPALTLNGKIFAIYGVYDYYRFRENKTVLNVLQASLTTVKRNIFKYRNDNDLSWYCQKHSVQNEGYHNIHVEQLLMLSKITSDKYFEEMSIKFKNDPLEILD